MTAPANFYSLIAATAYDWKGNDLYLFAHLQGVNTSTWNLTDLVQTDIASIGWAVTDTATGVQVTAGSLVVASTMFNTLQTGTVWTADALGFNFAALIGGANFPNAGHTYDIIFTFATTAGGQGSGCTLNITAAGGIITAAVLNAKGSGYPPSVTMALNITSGGGLGGIVTVTTNAAGQVISVGSLLNAGTGYATTVGATTSAGGFVVVFQNVTKDPTLGK